MRKLRRMITGQYGKRKVKPAKKLLEGGTINAFGQSIYRTVSLGKKDGIPSAYGITVK